VDFYIFLLLQVVVLLVQATVLDYVSVLGIKPDLVMLLTTLVGFLLGAREGAFWGFAAGIVEDLFCGAYIGLNAMAKMVAGWLAGTCGERLYRESSLVAAGVVFLSSLGGLVVNYLLFLYLGIHISPFNALIKVALPASLYTAVLVPLFFGRFLRVFQVREKDYRGLL